MNHQKINSGFSLIEVILALGLLGSTLLVLITLLPKTLEQTQYLKQQEALNNLLPSITRILQENQLAPKDTTVLYCWKIKTSPHLLILETDTKKMLIDWDNSEILGQALMLQLFPIDKKQNLAKLLDTTAMVPCTVDIYPMDLTVSQNVSSTKDPLTSMTILLNKPKDEKIL